MHSPRLQPVVLFLLTFALVSCAPRYETHYSYVPPATQAQQNCVNACEADRSYCRIEANNAYEQCSAIAESDARQRYESDLHRWEDRGRWIRDNYEGEELEDKLDEHKRQKPRSYSYRYSTTGTCENRAGQCTQVYNSCYESCGLSVSASRVCVANCE